MAAVSARFHELEEALEEDVDPPELGNRDLKQKKYYRVVNQMDVPRTSKLTEETIDGLIVGWGSKAVAASAEGTAPIDTML